MLSETLNETLLAWICEYNGLEPCLVYRQIKYEEDLKSLAETDKIVSEMGFELDEDTVRARYGDGWSKKVVALPVPAPTTGLANFAEAALALAEPDALDALIDAEQAQWQPVMQTMVDPIRTLLANAAARGQTAAELLAQLDADPLAESLARTGFTARLAGDAGLSNE